MPIELLDEPSTTELTVQHRAAMALNSTKTESDLRELAAKNVHIVAVIDKAGRQQAHGAAMELKTARTTIAKVSKDARDDAVQFGKAIIAEEKRLIALVEPEENRLTGLRDAWDEEQERIKREAEAKERARITAIHERIAMVRGFITLASQCRTSARIQELLGKLEAVELTGFEEFADEAAAVHAGSITAVKTMLAEKVEEEAAQASAKAEQEAIRIAQANEAAKLAAERAAIERERAELAAAKVQQAAIQMRDEQTMPEPDTYEQELKAFAAATVKDSLTTQTTAAPIEERASPVRSGSTGPTDMEIVDVLAQHYRVHESKVLDWLLAMNLEAVGEAIAAEFV